MIYNENESAIIFFDELCPLCSKWSLLVIKQSNSKIFFSPLSSNFAKRTLKLDTNINSKYSDSLFFYKDNRIFKEGKAIKEIIKLLSGHFIIYKLLLIIPTVLLNYIYKMIAKNRHRLFGRYKECPISITKSGYFIYK